MDSPETQGIIDAIIKLIYFEDEQFVKIEIKDLLDGAEDTGIFGGGGGLAGLS